MSRPSILQLMESVEHANLEAKSPYPLPWCSSWLALRIYGSICWASGTGNIYGAHACSACVRALPSPVKECGDYSHVNEPPAGGTGPKWHLQQPDLIRRRCSPVHPSFISSCMHTDGPGANQRATCRARSNGIRSRPPPSSRPIDVRCRRPEPAVRRCT
jgi:hypothetical protein